MGRHRLHVEEVSLDWFFEISLVMFAGRVVEIVKLIY